MIVYAFNNKTVLSHYVLHKYLILIYFKTYISDLCRVTECFVIILDLFIRLLKITI
jgi:hypothetical protein